MKMFTCASSCGTGDANGEAGKDVLTLCCEDLRKVTVADTEVTVTKSDEVAGTGVVARLLHSTIKHRVNKGGTGGEINSVMYLSLARKWVSAVAER